MWLCSSTASKSTAGTAPHPLPPGSATTLNLNLSRDKFGNVVDGAPDSVHRVYYYWALQQGEAGFQGVDGKFYPPRWVLKEMLVRGMHNLL